MVEGGCVNFINWHYNFSVKILGSQPFDNCLLMLLNLEQLQDSTPSADFSALIAGISCSIKFLMMLLMWTYMHFVWMKCEGKDQQHPNNTCLCLTVLRGPYHEVACHCQRLHLAKFQNQVRGRRFTFMALQRYGSLQHRVKAWVNGREEPLCVQL